MPSLIPLPSSAPSNPNKLDHATVRAARKHLHEVVRNDFVFLPSNDSSTTTAKPGLSTSSEHLSVTISPDRVRTWQEYHYASSDPSSQDEEEEDEDGQMRNVIKAALTLEREQKERLEQQQSRPREGFGNKIRRKRRSLLSHFRHSDQNSEESSPQSPQSPKSAPHSGDSQDALDLADDETDKLKHNEEDVLAKKREERKQRRKTRLEEEMRWNQGLDFWARRRDAWCCARTVPMDGAHQLAEDDAQPTLRASFYAQPHAEVPQAATAESPLREDLHRSHLERDEVNVDRMALPIRSETPFSTPSSATGTVSPKSAGTTLTSPESSDAHLPAQPSRSPSITQIPLTTPLLPPNDPARSQMQNTRSYGAIYSKVVVQGLTPSVPINLKTMTSALVQGWKQEGEWPAQSVPSQPGMRVNASAAGQQHTMGRSVRRGRDKLKERRVARRIVADAT